MSVSKTLLLLQIRSVRFCFFVRLPFLFVSVRRRRKSHQHFEPKRLGSALAAIRDTNVCIREYTDYWTVERDTRRNGVRQFQKSRILTWPFLEKVASRSDHGRLTE